MREILFRAKKNYGDGEWIEGVPIQCYDGDWQMVTDCSKTMIDIETIGQYTELTDKNDKKIFEGDILNCCLGESYIIGVVKFDQRIASFFVDYNNRKTNLFIDFFLANQKNEKVCFELIGNIYDNPKLLADLQV